VLRPEVTEAIRAAVFEELAAVGYARMSIEGIARRAGVGKTAVYRRWRSKLHLVLDLVSALATQGLPAPDTGSLEADLRLLYEVTSRALRHPVAGQILPDLQAEAARNPEIAEALQKALREGQQSVTRGIVAAARTRGEIRAPPTRAWPWTSSPGRCTGGRSWPASRSRPGTTCRAWPGRRRRH
jgi:AcrR family transcriptional regulator